MCVLLTLNLSTSIYYKKLFLDNSIAILLFLNYNKSTELNESSSICRAHFAQSFEWTNVLLIYK